MSIGTVVGGVDTHKDIHVAAALDVVGRVLGTATFSNTAVGHVELWRWLASFGSVLWVGIEGTGSYGSSLARRLRSDGVAVVEVSRPNRKRRRRLGKDDTVDAVNAALAVLSGDATVEPKSGDGAVESLRFVQVARRSAVKARSQSINQLQAVIDTAPDLVRAELAGMGVPEVVKRAARFRAGDATEPRHAARWVLSRLARRVQFLDAEIADLDAEQRRLVALSAPAELLELLGVGYGVAATLLCAMGHNPERMANEASFASLCSVSPMETSSGRSTRHRLNRGGNRDANCALWWIVITRIRIDPATRRYIERRTSEGKTKAEVIRCLKRYVAREIYGIVTRSNIRPLTGASVA